jgi:hypothetical protein
MTFQPSFDHKLPWHDNPVILLWRQWHELRYLSRFCCLVLSRFGLWFSCRAEMGRILGSAHATQKPLNWIDQTWWSANKLLGLQAVCKLFLELWPLTSVQELRSALPVELMFPNTVSIISHAAADELEIGTGRNGSPVSRTYSLTRVLRCYHLSWQKSSSWPHDLPNETPFRIRPLDSSLWQQSRKLSDQFKYGFNKEFRLSLMRESDLFWWKLCCACGSRQFIWALLGSLLLNGIRHSRPHSSSMSQNPKAILANCPPEAANEAANSILCRRWRSWRYRRRSSKDEVDESLWIHLID